MLPLNRISLLTAIMSLALFSMAAGFSSLYFWNKAYQGFEAHYQKSYLLGLKIYDASQQQEFNTLRNSNVFVTNVQADQQIRMDNKVILKFSKISADYKLTEFNINSANPIKIRIYRQKQKFKIADIPISVSIADQIGKLSYTLAQKCDTTIMAFKVEKKDWTLITAPNYWSCQSKPYDWRWVTILILVFALLVIVVVSQNIPKPFIHLSRIFKDNVSHFNLTKLEQDGTKESQSIALSINQYIEAEEIRLAKRISFFTAMSHDLGTPATRLRLRAELIEDDGLRMKFIRDIDHLTEMIKGSLHFMRHEAEKEAARQIDFGSLLETICNDYQDMGHSVIYQPPADFSFKNVSTFFANRKGGKTHKLQDKRIITGSCQPLNIKRAVENLIDNGLKFGSAVIVSLEASFDFIHILVKDNGKGVLPQELDKIANAFYQGKNAKQAINNGELGFGSVGLGLAIVGSIVDVHKGQLSIENSVELGGLIIEIRLPRLT